MANNSPLLTRERHPKRMEGMVKLKKKGMSRCQGKIKREAMRRKREAMRRKPKKNKRRMRRNEKETETKRRRICLIVDEDVVVSQILSRLPVKSLMRFKCVCKRWKSIIEENSEFINLHLRNSETRPSIFIVLPKIDDFLTKGCYNSFLSADLHFNGTILFHKPQSFSYHKILGPVGGLICFVDRFAVRIYNVSTRQVTPWINSVYYMNVKEEKKNIKPWDDPQCNFAFDQTTKKHKVIFIWCNGQFQDYPVCEVLTVGDNTWRVIDELPPVLHIGMSTHMVSANGSIYWKLFRHDGDGIGINSEDETDWVMAFDIVSEKFSMISVPPVPRTDCDIPFFFNQFSLSVVDGCLAVVRGMDRQVKMWILRDHNNKDWTQLSIKFPSEFTSQTVIRVHSVGTDEIILETYRDLCVYDVKDIRSASFYYYDRRKKTLKMLEINGISSIPEGCRAQCSPFVESLLPVCKKLLQQ